MRTGECYQPVNKPIVIEKHIIDDAVHLVRPAADLHAALREMSELMRDDSFQFGNVHGIDQSQPDLQVLANREEHAPERRVVKNAGVHIGTDEYFSRHGCTDAGSEGSDGLKQFRMIVFKDLDAIALVGFIRSKQKFDQEDEDHDASRHDPDTKRQCDKGRFENNYHCATIDAKQGECKRQCK